MTRAVTVAGAGMAGLVAAARLRELGHEPRVLEKGTRAGGSMLLSSCVPWRHREWEGFRAECPGGDERLQRFVWERFDDAIAWLEALGAEPVRRDTENPLTTGRRYDPRGLTRLLARDVELGTPLPEGTEPPLVLATGGFPVRLARERGLLLRANPWSDGAGLDHARARSAALTSGMDEFYGRVMPAPPARIREEDFVPLAQLYGREARILTEEGEDVTPPSVSWHESELAQTIGPTAWYVVERTNERIEAARAAGGTVVARRDGTIAVHVAAAVTHTIGGLRVDEQARVLDEVGRPLAGLWAAGVDVGGIATGGYASGLAQALVLGLAAAESVAAAACGP
jgi:FAD binding domain/NAD(P)-binding Rossmann-like domain